MESVLTSSPPSRPARSRDRPVLPAAVGPTTATIGGVASDRVMRQSLAGAARTNRACPSPFSSNEGEVPVVGFLDKARDAAKKVVNKHGDKINTATGKAADAIDKKTDRKHTDKIRSGEKKVKDGLDKLDGKNDDTR